jgi:hypothetical protein
MNDLVITSECLSEQLATTRGVEIYTAAAL